MHILDGIPLTETEEEELLEGERRGRERVERFIRERRETARDIAQGRLVISTEEITDEQWEQFERFLEAGGFYQPSR